ncbi:proline-rich proteoglycan 2-like [Loxodonta africana]|uniref:proline-rich proteoglycan 2-like n=1 Tax=Loxodonta africana TaxID=9785 RepID=UPI000C813D97|nr:proline-rich proteoglycan 2-like [Loxodonta africana]
MGKELLTARPRGSASREKGSCPDAPSPTLPRWSPPSRPPSPPGKETEQRPHPGGQAAPHCPPRSGGSQRLAPPHGTPGRPRPRSRGHLLRRRPLGGASIRGCSGARRLLHGSAERNLPGRPPPRLPSPRDRPPRREAGRGGVTQAMARRAHAQCPAEAVPGALFRVPVCSLGPSQPGRERRSTRRVVAAAATAGSSMAAASLAQDRAVFPSAVRGVAESDCLDGA